MHPLVYLRCLFSLLNTFKGQKFLACLKEKNVSSRYTWPFPVLWTPQAFPHLSSYLSCSLCGFLKFFCKTDLDNKNKYPDCITLNLCKNAFTQSKQKTMPLAFIKSFYIRCCHHLYNLFKQGFRKICFFGGVSDNSWILLG